MKINSVHFEQRDPQRFSQYLDELCEKKLTAKVGALQPHELLKSVQGGRRSSERAVAQAQWAALSEQVRTGGNLQDCIAVCDVSGSMSCEAAAGVSCMDVAISLSLLLAEASRGSCARELITFSENPQLIRLPQTSNLQKLDAFTRRLPWGGTTNFRKVFKLLQKKQPPPSRVFVFSDMQFSAAGGHMTDLEAARQEYETLGLKLPQLIFWNLRSHKGAPALASDSGVALVSGFSPVLMKTFIKDGAIDPLRMLCKALDTPLLRQPRVVCDAPEACNLLRCPARPTHAWRPGEHQFVTDLVEALPERKSKKLPWAIQSHELGSLPEKEAIAAFLGMRGKNIETLRGALRAILLATLGKRNGSGLRLWLDVITRPEPEPFLESGSVQVTVRARATPSVLQASLLALSAHSTPADAIRRVLQVPPPQRSLDPPPLTFVLCPFYLCVLDY